MVRLWRVAVLGRSHCFRGKGAPGVHREPTPGSVQDGGPQQELSSQDCCLAEMQCCTTEEAGKKTLTLCPATFVLFPVGSGSWRPSDGWLPGQAPG